MKKTSNKIILAIILTFTMLIGLVSVTAFAADGTTVYLEPGAEWLSDGATFAVYYWTGDTDNGWVKMTDEGDGIYKAVVPAGYSNIIFVRLDPSASEPSWEAKWNQTIDLTITEDSDTFTITDAWGGTGTWASGAEIGGGSTGGDGEGGDVVIDSTDGVSSYTVAGVATLCGSDWAPADTANDMVYNTTTKLYEKTFTGIPAGTYQFKVAADHGWDRSWGDPVNGVGQFGTDYQIVLEEEQNVTITFDPATATVGYKLSASTGPSENLPAAGLEADTVIYLDNAAGWDTPYIYCWGGDYNAMTWPGEMMDYDEELGLYYATVSEGTTGVIFNDGNGTQTKDIVVMPTPQNSLYVNDDLQSDFVVNPHYADPTPEEPAGMTWLQEIAYGILLFLRSIEDFFKGLFGG